MVNGLFYHFALDGAIQELMLQKADPKKNSPTVFLKKMRSELYFLPFINSNLIWIKQGVGLSQRRNSDGMYNN